MELLERIKRKLTEILSPHFLGREQEALVGLAAATLDEAQELVDEGDSGLQAQIDALRSEEGAGLIGIEDVGGNFVSWNVEGALAELAGKDITLEDKNVVGKWNFLQPVGLANGGFVANLTPTSLSANRTYTFKDASGTVAFLTDIPAQVNLVAGSNINITGTYPNLTISGTGGGGGTGVTTVNGMVGDVVLDYASVGAAPTSHTHAIAQVTGLQAALDGKASSSHTHSASDITSGVISTARLGTGTANSTNFLRGDGTWAEPPSGGGGGGGTVTSVNVAGGTGISATGGPITASGTISLALSTNLQGWSGIQPSSKQNALGFTPVQQGGGPGQGTNKIRIGWDTTNTRIRAQVDSVDMGGFVMDSRSITAGNGLSGGGVLTADRTISLGTPGTITLSSSNSVTTTSHTHNFAPGGTTAQYIRGDGTLATFPSTMPPSAHTHAAGDITSGTLNAGRIPNLDASKITAGTFHADRIPDLSGSYVNTSSNQTGIGGNKTFTGTITASNVTATSDTRLKYDITRREPRQELLEFVKLYGWKWIDSKEEGLGVLAQDVQKVAPEYVHEDENGMLSVDKAGLAIEMVMAMMEKMNGSSD